MLSKFVDKLKKRHDEQEQRRIGDIYESCIEKGCKESFLKAFDGRIWMYPLEQTYTFIEIDDSNSLKQWKIYLQVIVEKRPNHEKVSEWRESLKILDEHMK